MLLCDLLLPVRAPAVRDESAAAMIFDSGKSR
jgi:hypothetical protein